MPLQSELPNDKLKELLEAFEELIEPLGMEMLGALVHEDPTPDDDLEPGEMRVHRIVTSLQVLPRAFSVAVLEPDVDELRDRVRDMEADIVDDEAEAAVQEFLRERAERGKGRGDEGSSRQGG